MARIVLIGSSGHAKVIADIVERAGTHVIAGLIDSFRRAGETAFGYPLLGSEQELPALLRRDAATAGIVAIGDNWQRSRMVERIAALVPQFGYVSAVHPGAVIAPSALIGAGSVVMAGAVLNPGTRLGAHCIVNTSAALDHDCTLGDFASVAPMVAAGGNVTLDEYAAALLGARIAPRRRLGRHAVVGAGALVLDDVADYTLAYGVPARPIRTRREGDAYLDDAARGARA